MKISYCITSLGRFDQISKTLVPNLKANSLYQDKVEYILVDFNQPHDMQLENFVRGNCINELKSGYLKYFRSDKIRYWHAPICKNTAHMLASNDILFNLDGDNYIDEGHADEILKLYNKCASNGRGLVVRDWGGNAPVPGSGTYGRIAVSRKDFAEIGGFDEDFKASGYLDIDYVLRLNKYLGCTVVQLPRERWKNKLPASIPNSKSTDDQHWDPSIGLKWDEINMYNLNLSSDKISKQDFIANKGKQKTGVECTQILI
jgi:hypothetical protein